MRQVIYILFTLNCITLLAQEIYTPFDKNYIDHKSTLSVSADYFFNSNAITSEFVNTFYKSGNITSKMKDGVSSNLILENRLGAELNYSVYYRYKPDTLSKNSKIGFFTSLKNRNHVDARFSNDLFKLGFYGNKQFAGEIADLTNFNLNLYQYQQFQLGVTKKINNGEVTYGLGLSMLNGQQYQSIHAKKAELYTALDGQYIDFNSNIIYKRSDTASSRLGSTNGTGFSIDVYADIPYMTKENRAERMTIELRDIGMIWWNGNSETAKVDSIHHYEGVSIDNIFQLNSSSFGNTNTDSVLNKNVKFSPGKITTTLPAVFHFNSLSTVGKWQFSKGIRFIFNANNKFNIYFIVNRYLTPKLMVSLGLAYGGYSLFNTNTGFAIDFGKGFMLRAYSNNIEGFIVPRLATGQGAALSLTKSF
ncbi:MAG: hypothetical protein JNL63_05400 [Bacteroidia bacterium]|nr:hypothetical protein [Bacteroidia bacterium]